MDIVVESPREELFNRVLGDEEDFEEYSMANDSGLCLLPDADKCCILWSDAEPHAAFPKNSPYLLVSAYTNQNVAQCVVGLADSADQLRAVLEAFFRWGITAGHTSSDDSDQDTLTFVRLTDAQATGVRAAWSELSPDPAVDEFFQVELGGAPPSPIFWGPPGSRTCFYCDAEENFVPEPALTGFSDLVDSCACFSWNVY